MLQYDTGISRWKRNGAKITPSEMRWDRICQKLGSGSLEVFHLNSQVYLNLKPYQTTIER